MKALRLTQIVLFFGLLLVPLLTIDVTRGKVSTLDNRRLTDLPPVNRRTIVAYINDRLGLREEMARAYTWINEEIFLIMDHPVYVYGRGGYSFFRAYAAPPVEADYIDDYADFIRRADEYCRTVAGASFIFWLNPRKETTYREFLPPAGLPTRTEESMARLLGRLERDGVRHIYTENVFKRLKETEQVFNVKFDAGHWNDNGAFAGFALLADELRKDFPLIPPLNKNDFKIEIVERRRMPLSYYSIYELEESYVAPSGRAREQHDYEPVVRRAQDYPYFRHYVNAAGAGLPKLLLFGGSYIQDREKFIWGSFSEIVVVHDYINIFDLPYYAKIFQPDAVVFETAEYTVQEHYYPRRLLREVVFPRPREAFEKLPESDFAALERLPGPAGEGGPLATIAFAVNGEPVAAAYARLNGRWLSFDLSEPLEISLISSALWPPGGG
jgi:hypothetical protein